MQQNTALTPMKRSKDTWSKQDKVYGLHTRTHAVNELTGRRRLQPTTRLHPYTNLPMNSTYMWSTSANYIRMIPVGSRYALGKATNI